ncbi:MAG: nitrilase-related carbon-nitrogen hydrolase [Actinomycetota bacterium]
MDTDCRESLEPPLGVALRIALAQIDCLLGELDKNFARAAEVVTDASDRGADVVVFPELNLTGYSLGRIGHDVFLEPEDQRFRTFAAQSPNVGSVLGFLEGSPLRTYNSAAYIEGGGVAHLHRKLYLPTYGVFEERKYFSPGQAMRAFAGPGGRMAVLICNDAWQPLLPFLSVQDGAEVLLVPANSALNDVPGMRDIESQWREIVRFYAVMLQCYVVFVNRVGSEGELEFWGGSHVVDPSGEVVVEAPRHQESVPIVDIDVSLVRRTRWQLPLVKEARLGLLYRELDRLIHEGGDL